MNKFMKKLMSKKDGFTLVELVVVIAILAILAGVAVPVYSGYIAKANEAADQQKIEEIETAMAAALAMEGKDAAVANDYFDVTYENNTLTIVKEVVETGTAAPDKLDDVWGNFAQFYEGDATPSTSYTETLTATTAPSIANITLG